MDGWMDGWMDAASKAKQTHVYVEVEYKFYVPRDGVEE